ncbi:MAG: SRPBCC domain-containing protein [Ilumatobacter sp.]|uniref:SRPBCC domain-containing protein n=1 Tax=Ilumatobacter sp. TaxID=1967498 RepID=UPI003299B791
MTDDLTTRYDGVVERTAAGGVIRFERHLGYDIHDVWDAITTPERLADWWLPFEADITVDLREGGEMVFAGSSDGEAITLTCTILRIERPVLFEHTHPAADSTMRWELRAVDTGSILRLTHTVTDVQDAIDNCYVVGLQTSLDRLEPSLASRPEAWDWDAFAAGQEHYADLGLAAPVEPS